MYSRRRRLANRLPHSLQFDPCPRAGEPMVSRRKLPLCNQLPRAISPAASNVHADTLAYRNPGLLPLIRLAVVGSLRRWNRCGMGVADLDDLVYFTNRSLAMAVISDLSVVYEYHPSVRDRASAG